MDILRPDGSKFSYPVPVEYKKKVEALAIILRRQVNNYIISIKIKNVRVHKTFPFYRLVNMVHG
jgi:hypothetical protein